MGATFTCQNLFLVHNFHYVSFASLPGCGSKPLTTAVPRQADSCMTSLCTADSYMTDSCTAAIFSHKQLHTKESAHFISKRLQIRQQACLIFDMTTSIVYIYIFLPLCLILPLSVSSCLSSRPTFSYSGFLLLTLPNNMQDLAMDCWS